MNELLDLQLDEVSLVDSPANKSATVALFKRDTSMAKTKKEDVEKGVCIEIEIKTPEEEMAEMQMEAQQDVTEETAKVDKSADEVKIKSLEAEVERLSKALEEVVKEDVSKSEEMIDFSGEKVAKSAIPAPVLKQLEEFMKSQEIQELRKSAEEHLPNFAGTVDQRGKLLKSIGNDLELLNLLKMADASFAGNFKEIGKTDSDADFTTADVKMETLVKSYQGDKKVTYEQAYAAVVKTEEGKSLLSQIYKK